MLIYDETALREPNLLVPGKQPTNLVRIDWSNPITHKLVGGWIFLPMGVLCVHDRGYTLGAGASFVTTKHGVALNTDGAAAGIYQGGITDLNISAWGDTTVLWGADLNNNNETITLGGIGGTTSTPKMALLGSALAANRFAVSNHKSYVIGYTTFSEGEGTYLQIFDIERNSSSRQAFIGAINKGLSQQAENTGSETYYTRANACLGSAPNGWTTAPTAHGGNVNWYYMLWWDRQLTEPEMQSLNRDFYQLVIPA